LQFANQIQWLAKYAESLSEASRRTGAIQAKGECPDEEYADDSGSVSSILNPVLLVPFSL
jgi:hypothetical protein